MSKITKMLERKDKLSRKVAEIRHALNGTNEKQQPTFYLYCNHFEITHINTRDLLIVELQVTEEELKAVTEKLELIDKLIA